MSDNRKGKKNDKNSNKRRNHEQLTSFVLGNNARRQDIRLTPYVVSEGEHNIIKILDGVGRSLKLA